MEVDLESALAGNEPYVEKWLLLLFTEDPPDVVTAALRSISISLGSELDLTALKRGMLWALFCAAQQRRKVKSQQKSAERAEARKEMLSKLLTVRRTLKGLQRKTENSGDTPFHSSSNRGEKPALVSELESITLTTYDLGISSAIEGVERAAAAVQSFQEKRKRGRGRPVTNTTLLVQFLEKVWHRLGFESKDYRASNGIYVGEFVQFCEALEEHIRSSTDGTLGGEPIGNMQHAAVEVRDDRRKRCRTTLN